MIAASGQAKLPVQSCVRELVLVGNSGGTNVAASLAKAAKQVGISLHFSDAYDAFGSRRWLSSFNWHFLNHRPTFLRSFSDKVVHACRQNTPRWLLTTGFAPLDAQALEAIGDLGIRRINYLTDDPWNPVHRAPWFASALPSYDRIYTPRRANVQDLLACGCRTVEYLPFGFDDELFFRSSGEEHFQDEIMFAGGSDNDRLPFMIALIRAGFKVALYGDYWDRIPETKAFARGHATPDALREGTHRSKISLCLVRRANRDGHVMRSFEIPAMGSCMLTEDTEDHRQIFGAEREAVVYFSSIADMLEKTRWLLSHEDERRRMAANAHRRIVKGRNTYKDRLFTMLG